MDAAINNIGLVLIAIIGVLSICIIIFLLVDVVWKKWVQITRRTVWFLDYMQNRRQYQSWLEERKEKK